MVIFFGVRESEDPSAEARRRSAWPESSHRRRRRPSSVAYRALSEPKPQATGELSRPVRVQILLPVRSVGL